MAITRINKTKNYSIVSNVVANDARISNAARGLLFQMLTKPDDWHFTIGSLERSTKEGRAKIRSELDELKEAGYLDVVKKLPNESGTGKLEYEYKIYEIPKHCKYLENGDVYDTLTNRNITMSLPNTTISKETSWSKKIAKFLSKYIIRNGCFNGTTRELVSILPEDLKMYEGTLSYNLKQIEDILYEMYDIKIERKRTKDKRILYIYNYEDSQHTDACQSMNDDLIYLHNENNENTFHDSLYTNQNEKQSMTIQDAKNEPCTVMEQKKVTVQGSKNKRCFSNAVSQTLRIEPHTNTNKTRTSKPRTNNQSLRINEESSNEFISYEAKGNQKPIIDSTQKEVMPKEVENSHTPICETVNEKKSLENSSNTNTTHSYSKKTNNDSKKKYITDAYLNVIQTVSEDRNIRNSFYKFLRIREEKHHLKIDELTIRNFISQLHTYSSKVVNGENKVFDEAMQLILTNALASESKKLWELDARTMNQIVEKATEEQPLWSHINPNVRVLTPEEAAIREKEIDELYEKMTKELDEEYAKRKEEQKNGNNAYTTNYRSVWG